MFWKEGLRVEANRTCRVGARARSRSSIVAAGRAPDIANRVERRIGRPAAEMVDDFEEPAGITPSPGWYASSRLSSPATRSTCAETAAASMGVSRAETGSRWPEAPDEFIKMTAATPATSSKAAAGASSLPRTCLLSVAIGKLETDDFWKGQRLTHRRQPLRRLDVTATRILSSLSETGNKQRLPPFPKTFYGTADEDHLACGNS